MTQKKKVPTTSVPPRDGKEPTIKRDKRYQIGSGAETIHGRSLFDLRTQEFCRFGFYSGTGQGTDNGGGARHVLQTQGMSLEILGDDLKTSLENKNDSFNPAKYIRCKHGDIFLEAIDGDVILKGKNVRIFADGGDENGDFTVNANHIVNIKSMDTRIQSEKITLTSTNRFSIIAKGFGEISAGFQLCSNEGDLDFSPVGIIMKALRGNLGEGLFG